MPGRSFCSPTYRITGADSLIFDGAPWSCPVAQATPLAFIDELPSGLVTFISQAMSILPAGSACGFAKKMSTVRFWPYETVEAIVKCGIVSGDVFQRSSQSESGVMIKAPLKPSLHCVHSALESPSFWLPSIHSCPAKRWDETKISNSGENLIIVNSRCKPNRYVKNPKYKRKIRYVSGGCS